MLKGGGGNTAVFITAHRRRGRRREEPRMGSADSRQDQGTDAKADHDADQHPYARRSRQRQRGVPGDGRGRDPGEHQGEHGEDGHLQAEQRQARHGQADVQGQADDRQGRRSDRSVLLRAAATRTATRGSSSRRCARCTRATSSRARACRSSTATTAAASSTIRETLHKAHNGIKNVDTIINGHMPNTTTWADLKTFAEFNQDFLTWAQAQLKAGKTPEAGGRRMEGPREVPGILADRRGTVRRSAGPDSAAFGGDEAIGPSAIADFSRYCLPAFLLRPRANLPCGSEDPGP